MTEKEFNLHIFPCLPAMFASAFAIFRNADDASDAVQETMVRIWSKLADINLPDNPQAFCCKAVRNTCINLLRGRHFAPLENIDIPVGMTTDAHANYSSTLNLILRLLESFPEPQRKVLSLSFVSQLSISEITIATGESDTNVRQIICRGRKKLKSLLSNEL